jgi:metal-responsive CopG/Arc/MetJ family transcriptional regulator
MTTRKPGRPPLPKEQRVSGKDVHLLVPDELLDQVDARRGDKTTRKDFILKALRYYLEQPVQES